MLNGKVALVTGSTSGIGLAMARALAQSGVNVMLNGLGDADEIEKTRADLAQETGQEIGYHGANMMKEDEIVDAVEQTVKTFGSIDILVNNARKVTSMSVRLRISRPQNGMRSLPSI